MKKKLFKIVRQACLLFIGLNALAQNNPPRILSNHDNEAFICSRGISKNSKVVHKSSKSTVKALAGCPVTMAAWAGYSGSSLVQQLKSTTDYDSCLRSLFSFDPLYGPSLFSNSNIDAVAREMYNISISHDGTLNSGMLGLTTYLHAASYHDFFQTSVNFDANSTLRYNYAVESFANNAHLWDVTQGALQILDEYLIMCDQQGLRHKPAVLTVLKTAMKKLTTLDNWKAIATNENLVQKYVTAYNRMFFLIFRGIQPVDPLFEETVNNDPEFLQLLSSLATDSEIKVNNTLVLLSDNAVGELARMTTSTILKSKVEPYLASIVKTLPRLTPNWYRIIKAINDGGNCAAYSLCENTTAIRAEIDTMLFPNTFVFDDGRLTVKTSLSYETVLPLYYASKQVQAQFFRFLETDAPVVNDPNPNLKMVLYGTMDNYHDWQSLLNGLDTNNGGMYIENGATFYTYERTKMESTFSLEELFRHEYVHYLQGRYMINGSWGESPIYNNNRLVWFEEGMAEHFAGSTDTKGVTIRESQGSVIKNEGSSAYMSVSEILSSDYNNGFTFYRYGNMLWAYWFKNDITTAREIIRLVKADDIGGYDAKISQLKTNSNLQTAYTNYLNTTVINPENWWSVNTEWKNDKLYTLGTPADIQAEFTALTGKTAQGALESTASLKRFSITGTLTSTDFNISLNNLITQLNGNTTINNFKYLTGYYKNVFGSTATYIITGPLRNASVSDIVTPQFSSSTTATITGGSVKFKNESTGYIKGYSWTFPGGTPSSSTEAEPTVSYATAGNYNVQLTVNGNNNVTNTSSKNNYISIYTKPSVVYCPATVLSNYTSITNVSFANINNISQGFPSSGYSDFTNTLAIVNPGKIYSLQISPEMAWPENYINVWIDWNQNGSLTDPGDKVLVQSGTQISGSITIPTNAALGVTRMRIRYSYGKTSEDCGEESYMGEVEDYSVLIQSSSPSPILATPTNLIANANNTIKQVVLNWVDNATNETSYTIERAIGTGAYVLLATIEANMGSYIDTGLENDVTYLYKVRATNDNTYSDYSNVATASIYPPIVVIAPTNLAATANSAALQAILTWDDNATNETGYILERALENGAYSVITTLGANTTSYIDTGLTTGSTYLYKIRAILNTTYSNNSNIFTVALQATNNYCSAQGSNQYEYIKEVMIGSFTNTSAADASGYGNYTSKTITLKPATSISVGLTPGFSDSNYIESWGVWIDYNKNNSFEASEQVISNLSSTGKVTGNFTVASAAGTTRMRIVMKYDTFPVSACGTIGDGEVEDYTVTFDESNPNLATLATPTNIGDSGIYSTGFYPYWTQVDNAANYEVQLYKTATGWETVGRSTSYYFWIPKQGNITNYRFRVRAVNNGDTSNWSNYFDIVLPTSISARSSVEKNLFADGIDSKPIFTMYPNPASDYVVFKLENGDILRSKIHLYDSSGKLVDQVNNPENYNIRHLPSGIYIIELKTDTIREIKKLIIK